MPRPLDIVCLRNPSSAGTVDKRKPSFLPTLGSGPKVRGSVAEIVIEGAVFEFAKSS